MAQDDSALWRSAFWEILKLSEHAEPLKESSITGKLGEWTRALTAATVATCDQVGWDAVAKGYRGTGHPVPRSEYLALDVMAFPKAESQWRFPKAVFELENSSQDHRIAYSLWKVLCVRSDLRLVFCYRKSADQGAALIRTLRDEVVSAMGLPQRTTLEGQTLVVVGSRGDSATFPYGFFKWWSLDKNTGAFSSY